MFTPWQPQSDLLSNLPPGVVAGAMLAAGAVLLFFGWRIYRVALVVAAVALGGLFGATLGGALDVPAIIPALVLGVVAGLLAVIVEKAAVFVLGGLCAALPILAAAGHAAQAPAGYYLLAAVGFVLAGVLALLIWRIMIILCLSFLGTWLIANGAVTGLEQVKPGAAGPWIERHMTLFILCFLALWVLGVFLQTAGEKGVAPKEEE